MNAILPSPLALIAELTHRCPLHCVYCSNPDFAGGARSRTFNGNLEPGAWRGGRAWRAASGFHGRRTTGASRSCGNHSCGARRRSLREFDYIGNSARREAARRLGASGAGSHTNQLSRSAEGKLDRIRGNGRAGAKTARDRMDQAATDCAYAEFRDSPAECGSTG